MIGGPGGAALMRINEGTPPFDTRRCRPLVSPPPWGCLRAERRCANPSNLNRVMPAEGMGMSHDSRVEPRPASGGAGGVVPAPARTGGPAGAAEGRGSGRPPVDLSLYCLVDPAASGGRPLVNVARAAVAGGATIVQYRDKLSPTGAMVETARALVAALAGSGVPLLVNDRVDVALAAGAAGVHVGQDDMAVADARRLLGPAAILGLSLNSVAEAEAADLGLLDYVCGQCVFATASKADAPPPIGLSGIAAIADAVRRRAPGLPVGAISGITADNAGSVIAAGIDGVAVISAIGAAADPERAARALRAAVDAALAGRR